MEGAFGNRSDLQGSGRKHVTKRPMHAYQDPVPGLRRSHNTCPTQHYGYFQIEMTSVENKKWTTIDVGERVGLPYKTLVLYSKHQLLNALAEISTVIVIHCHSLLSLKGKSHYIEHTRVRVKMNGE
jgi:hypothetical protein